MVEIQVSRLVLWGLASHSSPSYNFIWNMGGIPSLTSRKGLRGDLSSMPSVSLCCACVQPFLNLPASLISCRIQVSFITLSYSWGTSLRHSYKQLPGVRLTTSHPRKNLEDPWDPNSLPSPGLWALPLGHTVSGRSSGQGCSATVLHSSSDGEPPPSLYLHSVAPTVFVFTELRVAWTLPLGLDHRE